MPRYFWPVGAMLGTQIAGAATLSTVPVLAPEIAAELGVDTSLVGIYTGIVFVASTLILTTSGWLIERLGAVRVNQLAVVCSGAALLLVLVPFLPVIALAAVLVGLGYGPNTPASSQVLSQVVTPRRRALAFSIKQSGAPIGGVLAGLLLPFLVVVTDWRVALTVIVGFALLAAIVVQPLRRRLDDARRHWTSKSVSPGAAMRVVLKDSKLRNLTLGAVLMMVAHSCYQTFYVAYLVEAVGLTLVGAGVHFAVLQTAGALSRIALGWWVDRIGTATQTLVAVPVLGACITLVVANIQADWPVLLFGTVSILAGVGSSGFYGVFLAEIVRAGAGHPVGFATGGALFFVYWAIAAGPMMFWALVMLSGSYQPALWAVAVLCLAAAGVFHRMRYVVAPTSE